MALFILENNLLAGIGIAVYAEVAAGIVHSYILANHTATYFSLPLVLEVFPIRRNIRNTTEKIGLWEFAGMKVIHQLFILRE